MKAVHESSERFTPLRCGAKAWMGATQVDCMYGALLRQTPAKMIQSELRTAQVLSDNAREYVPSGMASMQNY